MEVPVVSISPPTPGEESRPGDQYLVSVPGGFPVSAESLARLDQSNKNRDTVNTGIEDDVRDSDNDSIYSDAEENPSEMEGMGFGSIDAILDTPVEPSTARLTSPPESPLAHYSAPQPPQPARTQSWEETQARWSGIVQQTRQAPAQRISEPIEEPIEEQAATMVAPSNEQGSGQPMAEAVKPPAAASVYSQVSQPSQSVQPQSSQIPASQPRRKKKTQASVAAVASVPAAVAAAQEQRDSPLRTKKQRSANPPVETPDLGHAAAAAAPFRQSMRASSPPEVDPGFRQTMRNENRRSMPAPAVSSPQQRALQQRAVQPPTSKPPSQPRAALQKKHIPLATAAAVTAPLPRAKPVAPPVDNESDSESSFRKARRSKSTSGGQYSMRRSMRAAAEPAVRGDARNAVRSVSPVGRQPFSSPEGSRSMRTSMRASMDNTPTLRGSTDARRSSSKFGRQQRSTPALSAALGSQNNRSRIHDSDDEDAKPRPGKWRSRFADDSDDDSDVPNFAPVRGIPRKDNAADSTDLDDSSDEDRSTSVAQAPPKLQIPQGNAPSDSAEALSPNTAKKRGLLGMFRSKKPKDESSPAGPDSPQAPIKMTTDTSKPSRLGFASNAERDRVIAQTRAKLEAAKEQQHPGGQQQGRGKLQRRHTPERVMSDSWPLPPTIADEKHRPTTSDGRPMRNGTTRLNQGSMRRANEPAEALGRSGKKKKFPMLRKAFGLKD